MLHTTLYLTIVVLIYLEILCLHYLVEATFGFGLLFTALPSTTKEPDPTGEAICGCFNVPNCQSLTDGGTYIDFRIVSPVLCPIGTLFCCPPESQPIELNPPPICGNRTINHDGPPWGLANYAEYPWMAAILTTQNDYIAGAVLIADNYVLTAAHTIFRYSAGQLKVRLGDWDNQRNIEPFVKDYDIATMRIHPSFSPQNLQNDLALIELNDHVELNEAVTPACLPLYSSADYGGLKCWVSGWGKDAFNGIYQTIQKEVELLIIPNSACQDALRTTRLGPYFVLDPTFLCAGGQSDQDACTGDGGSPLVCELTEGQWTVVGLVAWGIGCGQVGIPGVYVNVASLSPWILAQMT